MQTELNIIKPTGQEPTYTIPTGPEMMYPRQYSNGYITVETFALINHTWVHVMEISYEDRVEYYTDGVCVAIGLREPSIFDGDISEFTLKKKNDFK